ncbi:unnamed protein product, partial [Medioppia subpectinata]
ALREAIGKEVDVCYCPIEQCTWFVEMKCAVGATCGKCGYNFCTRCRKRYHGDCDYDEARERQKVEHEQMSSTTVTNTTKTCPTCSAPIEKNEGCDYIICTKCNNQFCWLCKARCVGHRHVAPAHVQVLSHDIGSLIITFESPAGAMADQFVMDDSLKRARLNVRQCAPGVWRLLLTKQPGVIRKAIRAQVVVESEMSGTGSGSAIELYVGIRGQEANCPPLLVCRLDKAGGPVLGAHLTATVDRPDGTQTHTPLDRYHTDGYYYNYFTDYCGAGRYNVSVLAVNDGPNTTFQDNELGEFRRQRVAHSFQLRQDLPAVPPDDHLFDQLVANGTFAHLKQRDTSVQFVELDHSHPTPAAPVAALPSRPPISREMAAKRGTLSVEYIKMKKAIRNSTLSESDKLTKLDQLSDFNKYLTSTRDTNDDEIDSYRRRLVDIRNTL